MTTITFPTTREIVLTHGNTKVGVMPEICLVSHFRSATGPSYIVP